MKVKVLLLFVLAFSVFQISFGQETTTTVPLQKGYLIGPGDVITIKVPGEKEYEVDAVTVDEDGKIEVPFSDTAIMTKCRTEKDLRTEVLKLLARDIRNPQATVYVKERKSRPPVTVSGEVRTPGPVELRRTTRLLELISFSNGTTEDTNGMIQVFRTQPPMCSDAATENEWKQSTANGIDVPSRMYSLTSLLQGRDEANPIIYPGDVIVVLKASPVYITGEVRTPSGLYLKEGGLSLSQAIAMVGGVNREAKVKDVKVYRLKPNSKDRDVLTANIDSIKKGEQKDLMLEPYDIVEVNKSKKKVWEIALELVTGTLKTGINSMSGGLGTRILY
jgi:polysaccharide export outer membrane protein